jgi:hypothetical protein
MQLHINEQLHEAGGITATLEEKELEALRLSVEVMHGLFVGPTDVDHTIPHNPADFISYDPFKFMLQAGPNDKGEFTETWTKEQVMGFAAATFLTAREIHISGYSPDPTIRNPILGTIFAAISADSEADAAQILGEFEERQRYNPLEDTEARNSPGRRVLLGFEAARIAICDTPVYEDALAIVNGFNESVLVA